jgi:HEAT repeats
MIGAAVILLAISLIILLPAAYLLGRHLHRRQYLQDDLSAVTRQHIDLFQGGQLSEAAVESAKDRFRTLLEDGEVEAVEASLRPGTHLVVQVRALTEIGTDDAGRILERQLQRRLSDDQIEQSWYWIDLANGLRNLNREQSLPHLLRCSEGVGEIPLGHFLAAETVCFLGFASYLREPETRLGRSALRVLHRALEGLRMGVPPHLVTEARLGETVESLWDHRPKQVDPLVVRVLVEALRHLRRSANAENAFDDEHAEQEAYRWQISHLAALEEAFHDYLSEAASQLGPALAQASETTERDILHALADLRADAATWILPLLDRPDFESLELATEVLTWSRDPAVAPRLRSWVLGKVHMLDRAQRKRQAFSPRRNSAPAGCPYAAVLRALRGHGSAETEMFLLWAARDWDPTIRAAAIGSLAWWEPFHRHDVLLSLQDARRDSNPEVRQTARSALARLGERQALSWFRQALTCDDSHRVHEAIQVVANESIMMLWADLDRLADSEDSDISLHAREALERLSEDLDQGKTK